MAHGPITARARKVVAADFSREGAASLHLRMAARVVLGTLLGRATSKHAQVCIARNRDRWVLTGSVAWG